MRLLYFTSPLIIVGVEPLLGLSAEHDHNIRLPLSIFPFDCIVQNGFRAEHGLVHPGDLGAL